MTGCKSLAAYWPEYLIEATGLGLFMVSACLFALLLEHPASPLRLALPAPAAHRVLMGLAMGTTAACSWPPSSAAGSCRRGA